jgi:hypothetical protein
MNPGYRLMHRNNVAGEVQDSQEASYRKYKAVASRELSPSIELYPKGAMLKAPRTKNPTGERVGARRGKIKGWSKASRARMRMQLLTMSPPKGWGIYGGSFTIPPPNDLTWAQQKKMWLWYCHEVQRVGACMVWRVEVQERGVLHWHTVMSSEGTIEREGAMLPAHVFFTMLWWDAVKTLGEVNCPEGYYGGKGTWKKGITHAPHRMAMDGAYLRAAVVEQDGGTAAWARYLQDHATKSKQEQIADGAGRHWGVVGRKLYHREKPVRKEELTKREYAAVLRCFQRLCTPFRKDDRVPFGRRLGYRPSRGRWGRSVTFTRTDTMKRLIDWARKEKGGNP